MTKAFARLRTAALSAAIVLATVVAAQAETVFNRGNGAEPETLDPHKSTGVTEANLIYDMLEGLLVFSPDGQPVPGVAAAAKQMGRYAARLIKARLAGQSTTKPFRYIDYGNLATIGRKAAVADFGRFRLSGLLAWLLWTFAHLWFLVGFRNRIVVFLDWAWAYATFDRGARLITERRAG